MIGQQDPAGVTNGFTYQQYEMFRDHGRRARPRRVLAGRAWMSASTASVEPTTDGQLVTGDYFPLLGVRPALGPAASTRATTASPMGHPVAVLSHGYWQRRFGGDPAVVGRSISLSGMPFTIVGVTPAEFFGAEVGTSPSLFLPVMMQPA